MVYRNRRTPRTQDFEFRHASQAGRSLGSSHGIVRRSRSTSRLIFRERIASAWLWSASHDDLRCLAWANASGFATRIGAPSAKATNASRVSV